MPSNGGVLILDEHFSPKSKQTDLWQPTSNTMSQQEFEREQQELFLVAVNGLRNQAHDRSDNDSMIINQSESGQQDPDVPREEKLLLPEVKYVLGDAKSLVKKLRGQIHK